MYYYQYDAVVRDGKENQRVTYLIKSLTELSEQDMVDCLEFQLIYLKTVILFDAMLVNSLTQISEIKATKEMRYIGKCLKDVPTVHYCDLAQGLQS